MKLMVFDIETTGFLEDKNAVMTELAWVIWDTYGNRVINAESLLIDSIRGESDVEVPKLITELTGITAAMLLEHGVSVEAVLNRFTLAAEGCHAYVTRNGWLFDWPFLKREAARIDFLLHDLPLIDDRHDIPYPASKANTLSYVAADHGFLNPFPHSALGDAVTLMTVLQRGKYDMQAALESAKSPLVEVRAHVSFEKKDLAKEAKFFWEPNRKLWLKHMREAAAQKADFPFQFSIVGKL